MRKTRLIAPVLAVIAGIAGFFLRKHELATVYDMWGLAVRGMPVTITLIVLSVFVVAAAAVFALTAGKRRVAASLETVVPKDMAGKAAFWLAAVLFVIGAIGCFVYPSVFRWRGVAYIFALFALASGAAYAMLPTAQEKPGQVVTVLSVVPALFFSLWLIVCFRTNATDPQLIDYCYEVLAAAAMAFACYCEAGYAYGVSKPGKTAAAALIALYFGIVSLADGTAVWLKAIMLGACIAQAASVAVLLTAPEKE
ncbi:MAG: hypothetical protein IK136_00150 [Oscillospiraceae bacterium]|nr:hypothetical protein [Oscillospiraceae bacterium]